jgi:membrane-bound lytic murein transglycosylase D
MVAESRCKPNAVSHKGARGFWQLMPHTSRAYGCYNPDDFECATKAAAKYIKQLESRFRTYDEVVIAYNMGGHNYQKHGKSGQALGLVYRIKAIRRADK